MLAKLFGVVLGFLTGGNGASKAAGAFNGLALIGAIGGAVLWLFGPGRDWQITLNALELSGVVLGGSLLLEYFRRMPPPSV